MDVEAVRDRVAQAARRAGRDPAEVTLIAVTKGHPLAVARGAAAAGLRELGENRVPEAVEKQDAWPDAGVRWHLIGHLQRNKAKLAVGRFVLIHSLDSVRLAEALEQAAAARNLVQDVLVEVNVAMEPQKSGVLPAEAEALVRHAAGLPHLAVKGLMTVAPFTDDPAVLRATFRGLRELGERVRAARGPGGDWQLSMGMSNDFEIAIEEGATMVRLGTVLFGERPT